MATKPACWVYFLACGRDAALYIGVADDLARRFVQHVEGKGSLFTSRKEILTLIGAFPMDTRRAALQTEYRLKRMRRQEKLRVASMAASCPEWLELKAKDPRLSIKASRHPRR